MKKLKIFLFILLLVMLTQIIIRSSKDSAFTKGQVYRNFFPNRVDFTVYTEDESSQSSGKKGRLVQLIRTNQSYMYESIVPYSRDVADVARDSLKNLISSYFMAEQETLDKDFVDYAKHGHVRKYIDLNSDEMFMINKEILLAIVEYEDSYCVFVGDEQLVDFLSVNISNADQVSALTIVKKLDKADSYDGLRLMRTIVKEMGGYEVARTFYLDVKEEIVLDFDSHEYLAMFCILELIKSGRTATQDDNIRMIVSRELSHTPIENALIKIEVLEIISGGQRYFYVMYRSEKFEIDYETSL